MDGISSTTSDHASIDNANYDQDTAAVCDEHAETIVQSLQIQKDGLIDDVGTIQSRIDQLSRQLEEIDAKHNPVEEGLKGAISPNPVSSALGAIVGCAGSLARESVEMAPVQEAMRQELKAMEDKLWSLDYVDNEIRKQIENCED